MESTLELTQDSKVIIATNPDGSVETYYVPHIQPKMDTLNVELKKITEQIELGKSLLAFLKSKKVK